MRAQEVESALEEEPLFASPEDRARPYEWTLSLSAHAARRLRAPVAAGFLVCSCCLCSGLSHRSAGTILFFCMKASNLALHVPHSVLILLLFLVGYWFTLPAARALASGADRHAPGSVVVLVAITLGG
jgi:hypothetical protein